MTLISCTYEKRVSIESIDEQLEDISKNYEYVNSVKVTYLDRTIFFKVDVKKENIELKEEDLLNDLQTLLEKKDVQGKIDEYYYERYDDGKLNKEYPTLKIVFISSNADFADFAYSLYKEKTNNEYIYVEEWDGPFYDLDGGY